MEHFPGVFTGIVWGVFLLGALEWGGAFLGLTGAFLLATHGKHARYGWVFFLMSNIVLGFWAYLTGAMGLLVLQAGFMVTSLLGVKQSGLIGYQWKQKKHPDF